MRATAMVTVLGVESKHGKEGRTFNRAHLFFMGEDMGAMECGVPDDKVGLMDALRANSNKPCEVTLNIRVYKGTTFVDCVAIKAPK